MNKIVEVVLPSDTEIQISRSFNAPRELVYRCYTEPALIRKWMSGPPGWAFEVCEVDLRVGGSYRYVWSHTDGSRMGLQGVYREIKQPQKLTDRQWYEGFENDKILGEVSFTQNDSTTRVVTLLTYPSSQMRDFALKSGMTEGMEMSFNNLEKTLTELAQHGANTMQKITTFLWYDDNAKQAAEFYCAIFKNSKIVQDGGMVVTFELDGQRFMALNGGPHFKFNEAISLYVTCEGQAEVDYYWGKLLTDGGEESQCGWLKDKFGVSWQIVPTALGKLLGNPDPAKSGLVMQAMLQMRKLDIATLEKAAQSG